jgi:hypothetical protein
MSERVIATLHAVLSDGSDVVQGQTVDLTSDDEKRLEEQRALVPTQFDSFAEFDAYKQDAYRGGRGDLTAAGRLQEARAGGIVDIEAVAGGTSTDVAQLAEWLRTEGPTADETVAAAEDDPAKAQAILDAEKLATGNEPRKTVEKALNKIIEG